VSDEMEVAVDDDDDDMFIPESGVNALNRMFGIDEEVQKKLRETPESEIVKRTQRKAEADEQ